MIKDLLKTLDKKLTTLKISFKGEICRIRFIDGVHLNVDSSRFGIRYLAKIESITDKIITLRFLTPVKEVKNLKGKEIEISFPYLRSFYYFAAEVLEHKESILVISRPTEILKKQRREFFRLSLNVPVTVKKVYNSRMDVAIFQEYFEQGIKSKDISRGGLRMEKDYMTGMVDSGIEFISNQNIAKNSIVELELVLPDTKQTIRAICQVEWIHKVGQKYEIGVSFYDLRTQDHMLITNYITQKKTKTKPGRTAAKTKKTKKKRK